jgi:hypothetical protein
MKLDFNQAALSVPFVPRVLLVLSFCLLEIEANLTAFLGPQISRRISFYLQKFLVQ